MQQTEEVFHDIKGGAAGDGEDSERFNDRMKKLEALEQHLEKCERELESQRAGTREEDRKRALAGA